MMGNRCEHVQGEETKSRKKAPLGYGRASGPCGTRLTHMCVMDIGRSQRLPGKEGRGKGAGAQGRR